MSANNQEDFDITDLGPTTLNFNYIAGIVFVLVIMLMITKNKAKRGFRPRDKPEARAKTNSKTSSKTSSKPPSRPLIAIDSDGNGVELPAW